MVHKRATLTAGKDVKEFKGFGHYKKGQNYAVSLAKQGYDFRVFTFPADKGTIVLKLKKSKRMKSLVSNIKAR